MKITIAIAMTMNMSLTVLYNCDSAMPASSIAITTITPTLLLLHW